MKKLDLVIKKNGYTYTQVKRTDKKAMYKSNTGFYEVFYIQVQEAGESVIGGNKVIFEHKELFPNDESFGKTAWCFSTGKNKLTAYDLAEDMYNSMWFLI